MLRDRPDRLLCRGRGPSRGLPASLRRPRRAAADDRGDRRGTRSRRHAGRRLRSHRDRRAGRPRVVRAVGPQARRPPRSGDDVHPRHQGGRHRHRARSRGPPRIARPRRDPARPETRRLPVRPTNNAGGLEGGVTNGEDVRVTGFMKPISTLMKPLRSVDLTTMTEAPAAIERSDVCAVPAAAVVGEAMVAFVLADAFLEKFGGDSIDEIERHYDATAEQVAPALRGAPHACVIRPILRYGDQALHQPAAPVAEITPDIQQLIDDMIQTMYAAPGIGLAATQVGVAAADLRCGRLGRAQPGRSARCSSTRSSSKRTACSSKTRAASACPASTPRCPAVARGRQGAGSRRQRAGRRGHRPARPLLPARDGSSRRHGVRRSPARASEGPDRPEDQEAVALRQMVSAPIGPKRSASCSSARRSLPCRRSRTCSPRATRRAAW